MRAINHHITPFIKKLLRIAKKSDGNFGYIKSFLSFASIMTESDTKQRIRKAAHDLVIQYNKYACKKDIDNSENAVHEIFLVMEMMAEMFKTMNPSILHDMQKYHPAAFSKFKKHKNEFLYNVCTQNLLRGVQEELYRPEISVDILCRYRVETMFIPFHPEFQQSLKQSLAKIEEEILMHFFFGLVSQKGYKLIIKYREQIEKESAKK